MDVIKIHSRKCDLALVNKTGMDGFDTRSGYLGKSQAEMERTGRRLADEVPEKLRQKGGDFFEDGLRSDDAGNGNSDAERLCCTIPSNW